MKRFAAGDSIRFTTTGITGKIVYIGQAVDFYGFDFVDDGEERYFVKISQDDVEMVVEGSDDAIFSFPTSEINGIERI